MFPIIPSVSFGIFNNELFSGTPFMLMLSALPLKETSAE
jgi:hypothetical protein